MAAIRIAAIRVGAARAPFMTSQAGSGENACDIPRGFAESVCY